MAVTNIVVASSNSHLTLNVTKELIWKKITIYLGTINKGIVSIYKQRGLNSNIYHKI